MTKVTLNLTLIVTALMVTGSGSIIQTEEVEARCKASYCKIHNEKKAFIVKPEFESFKTQEINKRFSKHTMAKQHPGGNALKIRKKRNLWP